MKPGTPTQRVCDVVIVWKASHQVLFTHSRAHALTHIPSAHRPITMSYYKVKPVSHWIYSQADATSTMSLKVQCYSPHIPAPETSPIPMTD